MRTLSWVLALSFVPAGAGAQETVDPAREEAFNKVLRAAESAMESGDFKTAEAQLKEAAAAKPHNAQVLYDLGFAQERNGEEAAAAKSYTAAIAARRSYVEPRVALGLLEARAGQVEAAHRDLLGAANLEAAAPEMRGRAYRALAQLDEKRAPAQAREELLAAVKLTGETPQDVRLAADLAGRAGESAGAEAAYRRALALTPGDVDATAGLARELQRQKRFADAETVLKEALVAHPADPRLVSQLATTYASDGKEAEALPLVQQLRASDPKMAADPAISRLLARLYAVSGDNESAAKEYAQLAAANPEEPGLLDDLGTALVKLQRFPEAESVLAKAASMRTEFHDDAAWGEAESHLAFAASRVGHPETVLRAVAARATVLPNSPSSLFLEATAHDTLHQTKEAERAYKAFLVVANGKFPDQEFQARHRLVALEHMR